MYQKMLPLRCQRVLEFHKHCQDMTFSDKSYQVRGVILRQKTSFVSADWLYGFHNGTKTKHGQRVSLSQAMLSDREQTLLTHVKQIAETSVCLCVGL